jgi:hypothetical protein
VLAGGHQIEQHDVDGQQLVARNTLPELVETAEQRAGVARLGETDLVLPAAKIGNPLQMETKVAAVIIAAPEALGGLSQQMPGKIRGPV